MTHNLRFTLAVTCFVLTYVSGKTELATRVLGGSDEGASYFQKIRKHDRVSHLKFKNESMWKFDDVSKSKAKSGSIFVRSTCKKYLLKSNNKLDLNGLKSCLPALSDHLTSGADNVTLPLYGCFYSPDGKESFLLMKNIGLVDGKGPFTEVDFKGSVGQRLRPDWSDLDGYKDNNMECIFESIVFDDPKAAERLMRAIRNSVEFYLSQNLMDYSLCLKIELGCDNKRRKAGVPKKLKATCKLRGVANPQRITFHFMGLLDYLTKIGTQKRFEAWFQNHLPLTRMEIGPVRNLHGMRHACWQVWSGCLDLYRASEDPSRFTNGPTIKVTQKDIVRLSSESVRRVPFGSK